MTRKNYSININQDDNDVVDVSVSNSQDFNVDKNFNDLAPQPLPLIPKDFLLEVKGYGAGHGVGMSQWGAKEMAEKGASFNKILKHYYTGIQIKSY